LLTPPGSPPTAIGALHEKGYLHYDVSASNVMIDISDPTTKGLRNGLLTDFDCATHEKDRPQGEVTDRIVSPVFHRVLVGRINIFSLLQGTYSFMAVDLLASGKTQHEFYHDLESLFYVICYISCVSAGPNGATSDVELMDTPLASWLDTENKILPKIGKAKYKTVNNRKDFETVLSAFHPYFEPLKPYVRKLRGVAIPPDPNTVLCLMDYMNWSEDDVPFRFKPMDVKAGELLKEYRAVLQEALEAMPDDDVKQDDGDKQQPDVVHGADTQNKSESRNDEMDGSRTVVDKGSDGCHLGKRKRDASDEGDKCDVVH
jgi:serine/threonine protein kinase